MGTQVLLCNPLCAVAYTLAAWRFFADRIPYEEHLLASFYPSQVGANDDVVACPPSSPRCPPAQYWCYDAITFRRKPSLRLPRAVLTVNLGPFVCAQYPEYVRKTYVGIPLLPLPQRHAQT